MRILNLFTLIALIAAPILGGEHPDATNTMRAVAVEGRIVVTELKPVAVSNDYDTGWATWSQRGELVGRGQMTDSQGRRYNVRILPGYVAPWRYAGDGWSDAGSDIGEYFDSDTWSNLVDDSSDCFEWGWKDSFWKFGLRDSGHAWTNRFHSAAMRTKKKTFGWPMAYPWAFFSSTVETIIRVPVGIVGAALGTVCGGAVVPVAETVWPTVKGVWNGGVNGVVIPVSGWAWNTVAAPPASLLASAPNPSRTDGVWMQIMSDEEIRRDRTVANFSEDEAIRQLAAYARQLDATLGDEAQRREELRKQQRAEVAAISKRYDTEFRQLTTNETEKLRHWLAEPGNAALVMRLAQDGWNYQAVLAARSQLRQQLISEGIATNDVDRILQRVMGNPPATRNRRGAYDYKTDPVVESLRIIEDTGGPEIVK